MRALLLLMLISGAAFADDAATLRCRGIADPAARLACYDAQPVSPGATKAAPPSVSGSQTGSPAVPPAVNPSTSTGSKTAVQAAPVAAPAPAVAAAPQTPAQFGLEHRVAEAQLQSIESYIPGLFEGWKPGTKSLLANGQIWQVHEQISGFANKVNAKATVRRGTLGSFFMDVEGTRTSLRVRRVE